MYVFCVCYLGILRCLIQPIYIQCVFVRIDDISASEVQTDYMQQYQHQW